MNTFHVINYDDNLLTIDLDILTICNYHCWYCYARANKEKWNKIMPIELIRQVSKKFKLLPFKIDLSILGGEPTLHPNLLEIIDIFSEVPNVRDLVVFTNGLSPKIFKIIECVRHPERLKINLSFHPSEVKNLPKFYETVDKLHKTGCLWKITIMISKEFETEINEFMKLTSKYPDVFFEQTFPVVDGEVDEMNTSLETELLRPFVVDEITSNPLTYDEVIYQKLNRFKGWKCHLRYFHIDVDGEIHENCFNDRRNILNDDLNTGIKICPFNKCVHDCMLETLKTKN